MLTTDEKRILIQVRDYLVSELEEIEAQKMKSFHAGSYTPLKAIYAPGLKRAIDNIETQFLNTN